MSDTETVKAESEALEAKKVLPATERAGEERLNQELEADEAHEEESRNIAARNVQQDLNQGMQTGTHDAVRTGINWGPAFRVRNTPSRKPRKKVVEGTATKAEAEEKKSDS